MYIKERELCPRITLRNYVSCERHKRQYGKEEMIMDSFEGFRKPKRKCCSRKMKIKKTDTRGKLKKILTERIKEKEKIEGREARQN